jgi:terminal uridylyltransferase
VDRRELLRGRRHLPHVLVKHPLEGVEVDTYFYTEEGGREGGGGGGLLQMYAGRNEASVGALLVAFFRYYTWEFDYREHVLSVRVGGVMRKEEKAEEDGWAVNSRLAVEDPFETWYNVTHFLKEGKHRHIRQEFARAYAMCVEEGGREGGREEGGGGLLARICEEAPDPPMRKQTMEDEEGLMLAAMRAMGLGEGGGGGGEGEGEGEGGEAAAPGMLLVNGAGEGVPSLAVA